MKMFVMLEAEGVSSPAEGASFGAVAACFEGDFREVAGFVGMLGGGAMVLGMASRGREFWRRINPRPGV
jgi:hypothetical protein